MYVFKKRHTCFSAPDFAREKKPDMFLLRDICFYVRNWRGQKGNGKGNSFPLYGQKMDISARQFPLAL
jgi:hypothetical protein